LNYKKQTSVQSSLLNDTIYKIAGVFISNGNRLRWSRNQTDRERGESRGLMEWETEHWTEIEMAWVENGH